MPSDREIFHFHDGEKEVYFDPFALHRAWYEATGGNPNALFDAVEPPPAQPAVMPDGTVKEVEPEESDADYLERLRAYERLLAAARQAFELPPVDRTTGKGVSDNRVIAILHEWQDWQAGLKKNTGGSPPSAAPTTSIPKAAPAPPKNPSPSGSSPKG